jgi:16S rRNA (guanine1207-N2)-methyltransferase
MTRAADELTLESRVPGARSHYRFATADGVHSKGSFRRAELLLLDALWGDDLGRLLVPAANYGVVGVVLADSADAVRMVESSARAAGLCEHNAARNDADASVSLRADVALDGRFDTVAYAPKPYTPLAVGKQHVADALSVLRPGGRLYLAASKRAGRSQYEDYLGELVGAVETVAEHDGCRVLEVTHPGAVDPPTYVTPRTLHPSVAGVELSLVTVPGTFSASRLDDGTRLLLEAATVVDGERVLDLCCGYGAIGAYAGRIADCELWLSDDDRVATCCAERSLRASGVDGTVVTADCADAVADRQFDRVLCNPPTHAGDGVLSALFAGANRVLAPGGEVALVHHRALDLRAHLASFGSVERRRTGAEHVVLSATD